MINNNDHSKDREDKLMIYKNEIKIKQFEKQIDTSKFLTKDIKKLNEYSRRMLKHGTSQGSGRVPY